MAGNFGLCCEIGAILALIFVLLWRMPRMAGMLGFGESTEFEVSLLSGLVSASYPHQGVRLNLLDNRSVTHDSVKHDDSVKDAANGGFSSCESAENV